MDQEDFYVFFDMNFFKFIGGNLIGFLLEVKLYQILYFEYFGWVKGRGKRNQYFRSLIYIIYFIDVVFYNIYYM